MGGTFGGRTGQTLNSFSSTGTPRPTESDRERKQRNKAGEGQIQGDRGGEREREHVSLPLCFCPRLSVCPLSLSLSFSLCPPLFLPLSKTERKKQKESLIGQLSRSLSLSFSLCLSLILPLSKTERWNTERDIDRATLSLSLFVSCCFCFFLSRRHREGNRKRDVSFRD